MGTLLMCTAISLDQSGGSYETSLDFNIDDFDPGADHFFYPRLGSDY